MLLASFFLFIGPRTAIFIAFAIILLFGAKRIPELFRGVGQGVREFKDATKNEQPAATQQPYAAPQPQQPVQPGYQQPQAGYPGYQQPAGYQQPINPSEAAQPGASL